MNIFEMLFTKKDNDRYLTGKKIRGIRNAKRISAKELGMACSVNETAIRNYEQGIRQVSQEKLEIIAKYLGVTPSALYDRQIESYVDVMQILFELEDSFELVPFSIPQEPQYALLTKDTVLVDAIQAWYEQRRRWERKEITFEQLKEWEQSFPFGEEGKEYPHREDEVKETVYTDFERIIWLRQANEQQRMIVDSQTSMIRAALENKDIKMALYHLDTLQNTIAVVSDSDIKKFG